ncbi:MAG: Hsp20/alpha crystallin family protein [Patescibacteria group bacterium]|nr:Hsp20/alpha crystallin family protein [Patescibacteria group bacterium]
MSLFKKNKELDDNFNKLENHLSGFNYEEGQLAIDVYQADNNLIIKSTIAGAKPDDIDITLSGDILTIKGRRDMDEYIDAGDYLYRECYWGRFSRTIILPFLVDEDNINVKLDRGVLTLILPKADNQKEVKLKIE